MPTSKAKNLIYRIALPLCSPAIPNHPVMKTTGRDINGLHQLNRIIRKNHISAGAIAFCSDSDYSYVFSCPVHTHCLPSENTYYRAASITKMAVAILSVILMDKGILDPEKSVADYLPECSHISNLKHITIRHLLSHTAGIIDPPHLENMPLAGIPLKTVLDKSIDETEQGSFHYSNLGFGMIGCIFEAVLNRIIEDIFCEYLAYPAGLKATLSAATLNQNDIMPVVRILPWKRNHSVRITPLGSLPMSAPDPDFHYGYTAGSMYITLPSLVSLTRIVRDGGTDYVSAQYRHFMKQEVSCYGRISPTLSYGYGLLRIRDKKISDHLICGHQGFAYGCVDGAFWEETSGNIMVSLNGGCSEARTGRLGIVNRDLCTYAFRKEICQWK